MRRGGGGYVHLVPLEGLRGISTTDVGGGDSLSRGEGREVGDMLCSPCLAD